MFFIIAVKIVSVFVFKKLFFSLYYILYMGWVYFINEADTNKYKIGVTKAKTINRRQLELQTGNSNELILCRKFQTDTPYKLENMLHNYYNNFKVKGEWFELTDGQAIEFVNICEQKQNVIDYLLKENVFYN